MDPRTQAQLDQIKEIPESFFDSLGAPPAKPFGPLEHYRFDVVAGYLESGSVFDVGVFWADFLKKARAMGHSIAGTEVSQERVQLSNEILGEEVVIQGFRHGRINDVADEAHDNVVCMEVIEHVLDDKAGIAELCRISKNTVIITVPYNETLQTGPCLHCCKPTPYSGHLHEYRLGDMKNLIPEGWKIVKEFSFANRLTQIFGSRLSRGPMQRFLFSITEKLPIGRERWLFVKLQKN